MKKEKEKMFCLVKKKEIKKEVKRKTIKFLFMFFAFMGLLSIFEIISNVNFTENQFLNSLYQSISYASIIGFVILFTHMIVLLSTKRYKLKEIKK